MMDQPNTTTSSSSNSSSSSGSSYGLNKAAAQYHHHHHQGEGFQHPIFCNSGTTIRSYNSQHQQQQQQHFLQQQQQYQKSHHGGILQQQQQQHNHAAMQSPNHNPIHHGNGNNFGTSTSSYHPLPPPPWSTSGPHPHPPLPPLPQVVHQQMMHHDNFAPSSSPNYHQQQQHQQYNTQNYISGGVSQQQNWLHLHHNQQQQQSDAAGKRNFYDMNSSVFEQQTSSRINGQGPAAATTYDRQHQQQFQASEHQPARAATTNDSAEYRRSKKLSSTSSSESTSSASPSAPSPPRSSYNELPPTPSYTAASSSATENSPPYPPSPCSFHGFSSSSSAQLPSSSSSTAAGSTYEHIFPPTPGSSIPSDHYPPTPYSDQQLHSPNSEASNTEHNAQQQKKSWNGGSQQQHNGNGYLEFSHPSSVSSGEREDERRGCSSANCDNGGETTEEYSEFPLHDLIGIAGDQESGGCGEHHGKEVAVSDNRQYATTDDDGRSSAQDNSINSAGGESEGQQSVRSATTTSTATTTVAEEAAAVAAATTAVATSAEGGAGRAGPVPATEVVAGREGDLLPLYRRLAEETTKGKDDDDEKVHGGGGGDVAEGGRLSSSRERVEQALKRDKRYWIGSSSRKRKAKHEEGNSRSKEGKRSSAAAAAEAELLEQEMAKAVREMNDVLGYNNPFERLQQQRSKRLDDNDGSRMVRLEFHDDESDDDDEVNREEATTTTTTGDERDTGYANIAVGGVGEVGAAAADVGCGDDSAAEEEEEDVTEDEDGKDCSSSSSKSVSSVFELPFFDHETDLEEQLGCEIRSLMERQLRFHEMARGGGRKMSSSSRRPRGDLSLRFEINIKTAVVERQRRRQRKRREPKRCNHQSQPAAIPLKAETRSKSDGSFFTAAATSVTATHPSKQSSPPPPQPACVPSNEPCKVKLSKAPSGHKTTTTTTSSPAVSAVDRVIRKDAKEPFDFICLSCPTKFPMTRDSVEAIAEHVAAGFFNANAKCSAIFTKFAQRVKLVVNEAKRTVSVNTVLICLPCGKEFDVIKDGERVIEEMLDHLKIAHSFKEHNFCYFCDRRVSDMASHMSDSRFTAPHHRRLSALLTCGCVNLPAVWSENNNKAAANWRCSTCNESHTPHPALPDWLSKTICVSCITSTVASVSAAMKQKNQRRSVVLCSFCKQGKFGHTLNTAGRKSSTSSSVCVNCFDLLDAFRLQLLVDAGRQECRNYVCGMLNELVTRLPKTCTTAATGIVNSCGTKSANNNNINNNSPKKQVAVVPPEPRLAEQEPKSSAALLKKTPEKSLKI